MLGLLSPGWLIGLTSLSVPLALHLWSRRGGRPIRVGSIQLLLGAQPATRRHWAIQDLPLLLVRCATLASLVVALAGPYWAPDGAATGRRWALVASDLAQRGVLVDSLTRAGLVSRCSRRTGCGTSAESGPRSPPPSSGTSARRWGRPTCPLRIRRRASSPSSPTPTDRTTPGT